MKPQTLVKAVPAMDGAGVRINRLAGSDLHALMDPYLMIDEIRSDDAQDYVAGFPTHPHRGFETITYLLKGRMKHEDHLGNQRVMADGGVQWMTTGRGILHSEMPEPAVDGFHGFQIWLNLPSEQKMMAPGYHDLNPDEIRRFTGEGSETTLIAGSLKVNDNVLSGGFSNSIRTRATLADVKLEAGVTTRLAVDEDMQLMVFVYDGSDLHIPQGHLGVFENGQAQLEATDGLRALVLAGKPLGESVVQHGPFVMNSAAEIEQAMRDFADGTLAT